MKKLILGCSAIALATLVSTQAFATNALYWGANKTTPHFTIQFNGAAGSPSQYMGHISYRYIYSSGAQAETGPIGVNSAEINSALNHKLNSGDSLQLSSLYIQKFNTTTHTLMPYKCNVLQGMQTPSGIEKRSQSNVHITMEQNSCKVNWS